MAKVLIIDDSNSSRLLLKGVIEHLGHQTLEAVDGEAGLALLAEHWPVSMVLLDWHMAKMDGPTFLKRVRSDPDVGKVPVVMVTAEANPTHVRDAILMGLSGYILKPFSKQVIQERLETLLLQPTEA